MRRMLKIMVTGVLLTLLASCGGGSGNFSSGVDDAIKTGVFVDGLVEGVAYKTSSGLSGLTSARGEYQFRSGDTISFSVGSFSLGEFKADQLVTVLDSATPGELALFLQAIDEDGNAANGIQISDEMANKFANSSSDIKSVVPGDPEFNKYFLLLTGKKFEGNAVSALAHAKEEAMKALLNGSVLWQYYKGDINLSTGKPVNVSTLEGSARHRLELYAYRYLVYPQILTQQYVVNSENGDLQAINAKIQEVAGEIATIAATAVAVRKRVEDGETLTKVLFEESKSEIQDGIFDYFAKQVDDLSAISGSAALRFVGSFFYRFSSSAWACKDVAGGGYGVLSCGIDLSESAFSAWSDGITAYKLSNNIELLHTLTAAEALLDAYYRHAGDWQAIKNEFGLFPGLTWETFLRSFPSKIGAPKADWFGVQEIFYLHQLDVSATVETLTKSMSLQSALRAGDLITVNDFGARIVPGTLAIRDGSINVCIDLTNNLLAAPQRLKVFFFNDDGSASQSAQLLFSQTYDVEPRGQRQVCMSFLGQISPFESVLIPLRLRVTDFYENAAVEDSVIYAKEQITNAQDFIAALGVPDFALQVYPNGPERDGLYYGDSYLTMGLSAVSRSAMEANVPDAVYEWRELFDPEKAPVFFLDGSKRPEVSVSFPVLLDGSSRTYFFELKVTNPKSKLFKTSVLRVDLSNEQPRVFNVSPTAATVGVPTLFTIQGEGFPLDATAQIQGADCPAGQKRRVSSTELQLTCQHNANATLNMTVVNKPGGSLLPNGVAQIHFAGVVAGVAPTILSMELLSNPSRLLVRFDKDMANSAGTSGDYVPTATAPAQWLDLRTWVLWFDRYDPNGDIRLLASAFRSRDGIPLVSDWGLLFNSGAYGPIVAEVEPQPFSGNIGGRVSFNTRSGSKATIPDDVWIRITPSRSVAAGTYKSVYCKVGANEQWGPSVGLCYSDDPGSLAERLADTLETFQVVVYRQQFGGPQWDCREDVYRYVGDNVAHRGWVGITVYPDQYQNRSGDSCR